MREMSHTEAIKHNNEVMAGQDPEQLANDEAAESVHVLFVLDDNGEANGTVRVYCSNYCREKAIQTNEDPIAKGEEPVTEFIDWQCEYCGTEVR